MTNTTAWALTWVAIMQILIIAGVIAWYWARDKWGWGLRKHHHRLVAVQVSAADPLYSAVAGAKTTDVLWRCAWCPHVQATTIEGRWTLADLTAWGTDPMPEDWQPRTAVAAITAGDSETWPGSRA